MSIGKPNRKLNYICFECRNNKKLPNYSKPICQFCNKLMDCVWNLKTPKKTDERGWKDLYKIYRDWKLKLEGSE